MVFAPLFIRGSLSSANPDEPWAPSPFYCSACTRTRFASSEPGQQLRAAHEKSRPISRVLSWTAIPLADVSPRRSSDLPGSRAGRTRPLAQPASLFGLAPGGVCRAVVCCHRRGALLPHHFTLAGAFEALRRCTFCCTFRGLAPPRRYLAPCPGSPDFPPHAHRMQRLPGRLRRAR